MSKAVKNLLINDLRSKLQGVNDCLLVNVIGLNSEKTAKLQQAYDRLGRVVVTRDPMNAARSTSYDAFGRTLTQTDELGQVTRSV